MDSGLDERIWALVRGAGVRILWPAYPAGPALRASAATTTTAGGRRILSALAVAIVAGDAPAAEIELMTVVRERILATRRSPAAEASSLVDEYMEREARRALALRSLEIREGELERGVFLLGSSRLSASHCCRLRPA